MSNIEFKLAKTALTVIAVTFALSITSAANIPSSCTEEIITISKGNGFDMQKFISDLPLAVGKAKLQAKAPFGKPKDGDKMDIGITFGCLKAFPESPSEITSLLKDVGLETAKSMLANKSEISAKKENNADVVANVISDKNDAVNMFSQTYANAANNANVRSTPALKKCDAIFNPNKKFFYDYINEKQNPNINTCVNGLDSLYGSYDRIVDIKFKAKSQENGKTFKDAMCAATVFMCDYSRVSEVKQQNREEINKIEQ